MLYLLLGVLIAATGAASFFLVQYFSACVVVIMLEACLAAGLLVLSIEQEKKNLRLKTVCFVLFILLAVCAVCYLLLLRYALLLATQSLALVMGLVLVIIQTVLLWKERPQNRFACICALVFAAIACVFGIQFLPAAIDPTASLLDMRGEEAGNVWEAEASGVSTTDDAVTVTSDIQYASEYPNSFFDLYVSDDAAESSASSDVEEDAATQQQLRPVFIYAHGGGYYTGDKALDVESEADDGLEDLVDAMLEDGYAVVMFNYALSPEYEYPTPLLQMSQLVTFLQEHAQEYALDMEHVVLAGTEVGGQIVGQYAALQTNDDFSVEMGIEQTLGDGQIECLYLGCAAINPPYMDKVDDLVRDYEYFLMARGYFGKGGVDGSFSLGQANLIVHATEDYPPVYLTDGNEATFDEQAQEFIDTLDALGVENEGFLPSSEEWGNILNGYDIAGNSEAAATNLAQFRAFLAEQTS